MPKLNVVTLRGMRDHVKARVPFINTNRTCYGTYNEHGDYVVYSYGEHWPLFVCRADVLASDLVWFENEDKYGVTTSRHHSACHPHETTVPMPLDSMIALAKGEPLDLTLVEAINVRALSDAERELAMQTAEQYLTATHGE